MDQLEGKVAVVTGAASGIGRAIAERFAGAGMRVVLADIEETPLQRAADELRSGGAEVLAVPTDVSVWDSVADLREAALDAFGAVHVVCNNAGVGSGGQLWEVDLADWQWVLGVNLWGVVHGVRAFVPLLIEQGEGHVVNTASVAGLTSPPFMGPYNVSKHGVVTLSETLASELSVAAPNVGVSVLCPGWVRTGIGESDRNRPGGPAPEPTVDPEIRENARSAFAALVAGGLDPTLVADAVVDGIRQRRFYLLTHPDMTAAVGERVQRILEGRDPVGFTELFGQGAAPG